MTYKRRLQFLTFIAIGLIAVMLSAGIIDDLKSRKAVVVDAYAQRRTTLDFTPEESVSDIEATININTATAYELAQFLPTIGEVKAQSIVEYRELIGGFKSVDELIEISGIGEKTLETIRPYCRVSD